MSGRGYPRPRGPGTVGGEDWSPYQPQQSGFSGHPNNQFNPNQQSMPQNRFPMQQQSRPPAAYPPGDAAGTYPAQFANVGLQRSLGAGPPGQQPLPSERTAAQYQMPPSGGRHAVSTHAYPYPQGASAPQFPAQQYSSQQQQDPRQGAQMSYAPLGAMHSDRQFTGQGRAQPVLGASNQGMGQPAAYFAPPHLGGSPAVSRQSFEPQRAMGDPYDPRNGSSSIQNFPQQQPQPQSYHRAAEPNFGNPTHHDYGKPVYRSQNDAQGMQPVQRDRGYGASFDSNPSPVYSAPTPVDTSFVPNGPSFSYSQVRLIVC